MSASLNRLQWWVWTVARHVSIIVLSFWLAWLLRFDFAIPHTELSVFYRGLVIAVIAKMLVSVAMGMHRERWWGYQGFTDLMRAFEHCVLASAVAGLAIFAFIGLDFPRSVYFLDLILCFLLSGGSRFAARLQQELLTDWSKRHGQKGLLIYGAGVAGITLAREIRDNPDLGYRVIGFLDDDLRKKGARLMGLPVLGSGDDASQIVKNQSKKSSPVEEIVVAMPAATGKQIRAAVAKGQAAGVASRIVPGLGQLMSGKLSVGKMRDISVTDLLGREPVELDLDLVRRATTGRAILVTGAAGSIGSELCNQLAQFNPSLLIAFDQAESELFRVEGELRGKYPNLNLVAEVGDIRDQFQVEHVIDSYSIDSIFHAAAYKHVPLMERQVCEAVRNNVLGTWNLAQAAWRGNVKNFLLISTDKAVNPTSIMGLTKRIAELIVAAQRSALVAGSATKFVSVRFGNVLVSNGSVVPTFQKQIAAGGPVTVTTAGMRRYFMTVQEAVQLVLQASTMGKGREIFVLDMGSPVKIVDLARNMIKLAGFVPGEDIEIRFTGLRPGEKTYEEVNLDSEDMVPTSHSKIRVFQGRSITFQQLAPWISELQHLLRRRDSAGLVEHLTILVPEYQPNPQEEAAPEPAEKTEASKHLAPAASRLVQVFKTAAG